MKIASKKSASNDNHLSKEAKARNPMRQRDRETERERERKQNILI